MSQKGCSAWLCAALLLAAVLVASVTEQCAGNAYDPHVPPSRGLWFEGWYTRVVSDDGRTAVAALAGSFCSPNADCNAMQNLPGYVAMLVQDDADRPFRVWEEYPQDTAITVNDLPVSANPDYSSPPNFAWRSSNGVLAHNEIDLTFSANGVPAHLTVTMGEPTPWNKNKPGEGPEGLVQHLPLEQHWFVYSLNSAAKYSLVENGRTIAAGNGFAHQEKNWGRNFPSSWIWSEGMADSGKKQFALSGGIVPVGPASITAWLVGYRSGSIDWSFRPQQLPIFFTPQIDGCTGSFNMTVSHLTKKLVLTMKAEPSTFAYLAVPTREGFVADGCVESYRSRVIVEAYQFGMLVDRTEFVNAGLEFGGGYMCSKNVYG